MLLAGYVPSGSRNPWSGGHLPVLDDPVLGLLGDPSHGHLQLHNRYKDLASDLERGVRDRHPKSQEAGLSG